MKKVLLISKPNCFACKVAFDIIQKVIRRNQLDIELQVKCTTDLNDEENKKYNTSNKYPIIHFIENNEIKDTIIGTTTTRVILDKINSTFA